jgi:hypothetical protein
MEIKIVSKGKLDLQKYSWKELSETQTKMRMARIRIWASELFYSALAYRIRCSPEDFRVFETSPFVFEHRYCFRQWLKELILTIQTAIGDLSACQRERRRVNCFLAQFYSVEECTLQTIPRTIAHASIWGVTDFFSKIWLFPGQSFFFLVIILYSWIPMFDPSFPCWLCFEFRVICSLLDNLLELVCSGWYLHPLSLQHEVILSLCGLLYSRTFAFISVRSTPSSKSVPCAHFNFLGWPIDAGHFTVLHASGSCRSFNPPKTQDRCERAEKGGSASLLSDRALFACCWMWTTWEKWTGVVMCKRHSFCADSPLNLSCASTDMCKTGAVPEHQCRALMPSINISSFKPSSFRQKKPSLRRSKKTPFSSAHHYRSTG